MISFIIPTLNEESVLEKTLTQLVKLTTVPFEIIVSDGKSTDQTLAIAKRFTKDILIYDQKPRQTIANARNAGGKIARGDLLVFLDADVTIPEPNAFFQEIVAAFATNPKLVAATVSIKVLPGAETLGDKVLFGSLNLTNRWNNNVMGSGSAPGEFMAVRKTAFEQLGGFNEALVAFEDFEFFQRLSKMGKTSMLASLFAFHTGRRAHKVGHFRLWLTWTSNALWYTLFKKSRTKVWEPIR